MKRFFSSVLMLLLTASLLGLTGCQNNQNQNQNQNQTGGTKQLQVEVIAKGFQHDFWKAVKTGSEKAGTELNAKINFVGPEGEGAIAAQVEMLNNAINKKPDAICFAALDTNASLDALNKAKSNNIPIIGFDSGVPDAPAGTIKANASTDNYKAGELAAEKLFEHIKDKVVAAKTSSPVRIGVVSQEANSQSVTMRTKGFADKMLSLIEALPEYGKGTVTVMGHTKFSNGVNGGKAIIEVAIPAEITDTAGQTTAQTLLNKNDLIAIYGSNEFAAKAIINADAAITGGKIGVTNDKVAAVGFDSGALQIDAVKSRKFLGSITQDPVAIGYKAVELAVKAARGEAVADVDTGSQWYDSTNVDSAEIKPLLYQ